jgi:hypothetical protein
MLMKTPAPVSISFALLAVATAVAVSQAVRLFRSSDPPPF